MRVHPCANTVCTCTCVCYLRNPCVCGSLHACQTRRPFKLWVICTVVVACIHVKYNYRKIHTLIFHAISCVTCNSTSWYLRDFTSSMQRQFWKSSIGDFFGPHPGEDRAFLFEKWCYDDCWQLFWFDILTVNYNAKQKHLRCKKGEANQKQQLSDYTIASSCFFILAFATTCPTPRPSHPPLYIHWPNINEFHEKNFVEN